MYKPKYIFRPHLLALAVISACYVGVSMAQDNNDMLDEVVVTTSTSDDVQSLAFQQGRKASDVSIEGKKFKKRSATLGNALAAELGVHSSPFGGGSSAPIIRGQEGVRIKLLQNGSDIIDMSSMSPDHVVAADTLLAQQVELVRGTSTLMYGMASPAGVVNIVDRRIPTASVKDKNYEGEVVSRFDTASKERVLNAGVSLNLGEYFVARVEGLTRKADNYRVPEIDLGQKLNYLPDSHNKS
ncbi:TonB-dependent receptor plug domain-containing protein [Pasteurella bettyae]|uniref:TonB-dependent receptor plug domain protein n=1 Tax=Pasteurella bettyae CCUG 2042 TaxID=1095749 RepID=I3DEL7_9PAST|nr:Plug domain-containing protein [Pasteurella bettyae]EIJ70160.1 TonB-dependent receptor plug domain protein [Pasteurella bettyae CCUG 2042]